MQKAALFLCPPGGCGNAPDLVPRNVAVRAMRSTTRTQASASAFVSAFALPSASDRHDLNKHICDWAGSTLPPASRNAADLLYARQRLFSSFSQRLRFWVQELLGRSRRHRRCRGQRVMVTRVLV